MLEPKLNELGEQGFEFKFANELLAVFSRPYTSPAKEPSKPKEQETAT
jgi:hypothetical protein